MLDGFSRLSDLQFCTILAEIEAKVPKLARFTLDIMTIPTSSCDCERMFSEIGDLLEPKRRGIGAELLAAIQLVRSWIRSGFEIPSDTPEAAADAEIEKEYGICRWSAPAKYLVYDSAF
jgi:hypothetical protein